MPAEDIWSLARKTIKEIHELNKTLIEEIKSEYESVLEDIIRSKLRDLARSCMILCMLTTSEKDEAVKCLRECRDWIKNELEKEGADSLAEINSTLTRLEFEMTNKLLAAAENKTLI